MDTSELARYLSAQVEGVVEPIVGAAAESESMPSSGVPVGATGDRDEKDIAAKLAVLQGARELGCSACLALVGAHGFAGAVRGGEGGLAHLPVGYVCSRLRSAESRRFRRCDSPAARQRGRSRGGQPQSFVHSEGADAKGLELRSRMRAREPKLRL